MAASPFLEAVARDLFEQEWAREREREDREDEGGGIMQAEACPIVWIIPELVDLVAGTRDRHVKSLEPVIRRRVRDLSFINESGDPFAEEERQRSIDRQIKVMTRVLSQVKGLAVSRGQWSDVPVTPQMFG